LSILEIRSSRGPYCDSDHYLVVAKIKQRQAVRKQAAQNFDVDRFSLRKLNELEIRQQYEILTLRRLMSYIYGAPILDVSRSHTTTQHSR
jgi:hypothetical protein